MKIKIITILLSIFFSVINGFAQDFKADFKKANLLYTQSANIDSEFEVVSHFRNSNLKPEKRIYQLMKQGGSYRYDLEGINTVIGDGYTIIHYTEKGILTCNKNSGTEAIKKSSVLDIDKMENEFQDIFYKGLINGQKLYVFKSTKATYSTVEIYINSTTGLVEKTVQYYNDSLESDISKIETITKRMDLTPNFPSGTFSIERYVKISSDQKVNLQPAYAQHRLIVGQGLK